MPTVWGDRICEDRDSGSDIRTDPDKPMVQAHYCNGKRFVTTWKCGHYDDEEYDEMIDAVNHEYKLKITAILEQKEQKQKQQRQRRAWDAYKRGWCDDLGWWLASKCHAAATNSILDVSVFGPNRKKNAGAFIRSGLTRVVEPHKYVIYTNWREMGEERGPGK